jgi:inosine-uridine nucleoside N-ribohydrolase
VHRSTSRPGELTRAARSSTPGRAGEPANAEVALAIDRDRFVDMLIEAVARSGDRAASRRRARRAASRRRA